MVPNGAVYFYQNGISEGHRPHLTAPCSGQRMGLLWWSASRCWGAVVAAVVVVVCCCCCCCCRPCRCVCRCHYCCCCCCCSCCCCCCLLFFHACLQAADCEYRLVPGLAVALEPVACVVLAAWLNKGTGRISSVL